MKSYNIVFYTESEKYAFLAAARAAGGKPEDVILYEFSGYTRSVTYKEV